MIVTKGKIKIPGDVSEFISLLISVMNIDENNSMIKIGKSVYTLYKAERKKKTCEIILEKRSKSGNILISLYISDAYEYYVISNDANDANIAKDLFNSVIDRALSMVEINDVITNGRSQKAKDEAEAGAPKKRGRPAKPKDETEAGAPKKRGRPAKPKDETEAGAPKKRGRPAKPKDETETGAPKKRGRPANITSNTVSTEGKSENIPDGDTSDKVIELD